MLKVLFGIVAAAGVILVIGAVGYDDMMVEIGQNVPLMETFCKAAVGFALAMIGGFGLHILEERR